MTSLLISCLPVHFCLFNFFSPNVLCNVYVYTQLLLFIKECVSWWFKIVFSQNKIGEMWVFGISVIHQQLTNKKKFIICNISNLARIDQYSSKIPLHCHSLQMSCITNQLLTSNVTKSCRAYVDKHGGILIYLLLCVIECSHWIFIDNSIEYGLMASPCTFYCSMNFSKKMNGEQLKPAWFFLIKIFANLVQPLFIPWAFD